MLVILQMASMYLFFSNVTIEKNISHENYVSTAADLHFSDSQLVAGLRSGRRVCSRPQLLSKHLL